MNKIICLIILLIFSPYTTGYAEDRPKGFQGLSWGTPISKVEGLVPKKESGREDVRRGEKTYVRPSDNLFVADIEVKRIEYIFVQDLLAQGIIYFNNYDLYLNSLKTYTRLYGEPDREELDEATMRYEWVAKSNDEADVVIFYGPLVNAGFISMKCKTFLQKQNGLIPKDDNKMESKEGDWQLLREDDNGKWFYKKDGLAQADKDVHKIRVKCNLSAKRKNEWRISLKSKLMPRVSISSEEIRCSSKESRSLQVDIISERGPLGSYPANKKWEPIAPGSLTEVLYEKVCK